jgi:hypothetical protein
MSFFIRREPGPALTDRDHQFLSEPRPRLRVGLLCLRHWHEPLSALGGNLNLSPNGGPNAGLTFDLQASAYFKETVVHIVESESLSCLLGIEPNPIVLDGECDTGSRAPQGNVDARGPGVPGDVVERFLRYAVKGLGDGGRKLDIVAPDVKIDQQMFLGTEKERVVVKGLYKPPLLE